MEINKGYELENASVIELLDELVKRNLINIDTRTSKAVMNNYNNGHPINFIINSGKPVKEEECSHCKKSLPSDQFTYYNNRVSESGFLSRTNALCHSCAKELHSQRQGVFKKSEIPAKPEKGSCCPECNRDWNGKWHKHHVGEKFIAWICGNCNMSYGDRRNPHRLSKHIPQ